MALDNNLRQRIDAMCDELRGVVDASDFRHYILGFIFYRYLSERQGAYLVESGLVTPLDGESVADAWMRQLNHGRAVGDAAD